MAFQKAFLATRERKYTLIIGILFFFPPFFIVGPVRAQNTTGIEEAYSITEESTKLRSKLRQEEWIPFPYTIQISPYIGLTRPFPQRLKPSENVKYRMQLRIMGTNLDLSVLQIRRFIWKHFHCYPKLGLAFNYGHLENKGYLIGGLLYLEPQRDYLMKWEIIPRISMGITYANIPGTNFKDLTPEEEEEVENNDAFAEDFYSQGLHLDLSLTLTTNIKLTPHWQFSPSISYSYMPLLVDEQSDKETKNSRKDKTIKMITGSIHLGYTPNPSLMRYPDLNPDSSQKSRIDISWLSASKKWEVLSQRQILPQQEGTIPDDKYYYVWGIYAQYSFHLYNSHALTLATEWIHDGVVKQALKKSVRKSALKSSLLGGHEFKWGKLIFGQQLGFYLMNNVVEELPLYARLGLNYKLTDFLFVGISLKANALLEAQGFSLNTIKKDFIDFRIGYSFESRRTKR